MIGEKLCIPQRSMRARSLVDAQPYQGRKKGADGGIDGLIYFQGEKAGVKRIVVSVKGGENVSVAMVRDLAHVITREEAALGLFVTLAPPTQPMLREALALGYYVSPAFPDRVFPKLQILTINGLLTGAERPLYPDLAMGAHTFKAAWKEGGADGQADLFGV